MRKPKIRITIRPMICYWKDCDKKHRRSPLPWAIDIYMPDGEWIGGDISKNEKRAREKFKEKIKYWRKEGYQVLTRG